MKNQFELNKLSYFIIKETKKKERVCNIFSDMLVKSLNSKRGMLDYQFHFPQSTLHLSYFTFISFSPQSISFISSIIVDTPSHSYLPYLVLHSPLHSLHGHSTLLSVSLFSQSHLCHLTT